MTTWVHPRGALARDGWDVVVGPELEGWTHTGLRVGTLDSATTLELPPGRVERVIVPLAGSFAVETADGQRFDLAGRPNVFAGPTDVVYLGVGLGSRLSGSGRVAVAEASATRQLPATYLPASGVEVELRGGGSASREVRNFATPGVLDAESMIACEVITPAGNWSSYPPHKHDTERPGIETELEEIYYFESQSIAEAPADADPHGYQRVFASDARPIDVATEVRTGDVVLVPYGWHGPAMATPGYDLYYLNVMAGPGPERAWRIVDHPAHGWLRDTWPAAGIDPRLPFDRPLA